MTVTLENPAAPTVVSIPAPRTEHDPIGFVAALGYGRIALALAHSDMPQQRRSDPRPAFGEIVTWVMQGIDRVGGVERLWWIDYQARQINKRDTLTAADKRELARLRGTGVRRMDSCLGVAFHFTLTCGRPAPSFPEVETLHTVWVDEYTTMTVTRRLSEHDRVRLERYTRRSADGERVYTGPDHRG